jgi:hypothetical protein
MLSSEPGSTNGHAPAFALEREPIAKPQRAAAAPAAKARPAKAGSKKR